MANVFVSWSGGKDCCLATYRAKQSGHKIQCLASVITEDSGRLWPHMLKPETIDVQAEALDIPVLRWPAKIDRYNDDYIGMLKHLKAKGIENGVFGDVSVGNAKANEHLNWVNSVCQPIGITPLMPLWGQSREEILLDIINSGFEVIIIAAAADNMGPEFLGRKLDHALLTELKERYRNSYSGDAGYYHTFVVNGPIFKKRLDIVKSKPILVKTEVKGHHDIWYLDIIESRLADK